MATYITPVQGEKPDFLKGFNFIVSFPSSDYSRRDEAAFDVEITSLLESNEAKNSSILLGILNPYIMKWQKGAVLRVLEKHGFRVIAKFPNPIHNDRTLTLVSLVRVPYKAKQVEVISEAVPKPLRRVLRRVIRAKKKKPTVRTKNRKLVKGKKTPIKKKRKVIA